MDAMTTFPMVLDYLEKICEGGEKIDYKLISKLTAVPSPIFQRIFTFITGISIAEYVRKRRLSNAYVELENTKSTILEVAVKYGFESHSAFSRAFKEQFDLTPTEARIGCNKALLYPPLEFDDIRIVGGKRIMAKVEKITYREVEARYFAGRERTTDFNEGKRVWKEYYESPECELINAISQNEKDCDDIEDCVGIGCMYDFKDDMHFTLMIGDFLKANRPCRKELSYKMLPKGKIAEIRVEGKDVSDILESAYLLITEAVKKTDHKIDMEHFYWCEIYTLERYAKKLEKGEKVQIDYIVPVVE